MGLPDFHRLPNPYVQLRYEMALFPMAALGWHTLADLDMTGEVMNFEFYVTTSTGDLSHSDQLLIEIDGVRLWHTFVYNIFRFQCFGDDWVVIPLWSNGEGTYIFRLKTGLKFNINITLKYYKVTVPVVNCDMYATFGLYT